MKSFCVTLIVTAGLLYFACQMERPPRDIGTEVHTFSNRLTSHEAGEDRWRRTAHGWEKKDEWVAVRPPAETPNSAFPFDIAAVHPALIATLQLLISLGALLWHEPEAQAPARG